MRTAALYRMLGRKPPSPGVVSSPPPSTRLQEAEYIRHLRAFWTLWTARVMAYARTVRRDSARADAGPGDFKGEFDQTLAAAGLRDYLGALHDKVAEKQAAYLQRVVKIPVREAATKSQQEDFIQRNVRLISNLRDEHVEDLAKVFRQAAAAGQRHEDLIGEVQERLGVGFSRAKLIARDQVAKLSGELQQNQQQAAGIEEYEWSTAGDEAVRPDHRRLNGRRFRWDSPPVVNQRTGERRNPGGDIQCRCVAKPVIPLLDDI